MVWRVMWEDARGNRLGAQWGGGNCLSCLAYCDARQRRATDKHAKSQNNTKAHQHKDTSTRAATTQFPAHPPTTITCHILRRVAGNLHAVPAAEELEGAAVDARKRQRVERSFCWACVGDAWSRQSEAYTVRLWTTTSLHRVVTPMRTIPSEWRVNASNWL